MTLTAGNRMAIAALTEARNSVAHAFAQLHIASEYVETDSGVETYNTGHALHEIEMNLRLEVAEILRFANGRVTKWELILDSERERLESQAFGGRCSECGVRLETEAEFARHFVIADARYLNVGTCDATDADIANARETETDRDAWVAQDR